jgi:hypothetical protein
MVSKLSTAMFVTPAKFNSVIIDGNVDSSSDDNEIPLFANSAEIEATQDLTPLAGTLEELSKLHCESAIRVEQTVNLADAQCASARFPYFPPPQSGSESGEEEEEEVVEQPPVGTRDSLMSYLTHKFMRYDHIPPISAARLDQLNARVRPDPHAVPESVRKVTRGKARLPADYLEFNQRRQKRGPGGPTTMSGTTPVPKLPKTAGSSPPQRPPPRARRAVLVDEVQRLPDWRPQPIPDAKPSFVGRVVEEKERPPGRPINWRHHKLRIPPKEPPEPIPSVPKELPRPQLAEFQRFPARRTREYIHEVVRQRIGPSEEVGPVEEEDFGEIVEAEETPPRGGGKRRQLEELLAEGEIAEWEPPKAREPLVVSDDDEFVIPDECLTDSEGEEFIRPKPAYYDPHETKAAKLRNQAVRQRLALKEAKEKLEAQEQRARERHRRKVGERMKPTLDHLEKEVELKKPDVDQLRRDKDEQNQRDAVEPICSAIRSAVNTDFIVSRQMGVNAVVSERNRERKDEKGREERDEQAKLAARGRKKRRNMALYDPR